MSVKIRKVTNDELKNAEGRCYICAFRYMAKISNEVHHYRLVHGEMIKMNNENNGIRFGHAWIEKNNEFVIDLRHDLRRKPLVVPKNIYYDQFHVIEKTVRKYTQKEMWEIGRKAGGHFGPWH